MEKPIEELQSIALQVRKDILEMVYKAGSGHPGGSLSAVELLVSLYFGKMDENSHFFLSNGHVCPALYSVMIEKGIIDRALLSTYTELDSPLQGHPEKLRIKGIEITSGSLGMGLGVASGFAAIKKDKTVYCMTSDGEHNEGSHWEAVNFAAKYSLSNLIQIIDKNGIQIEGTTEEIMPLGNLKEKYEAASWNVFEINGHNFEEIMSTLDKIKKGEEISKKEKPTVIIANTIFGRGISFMEENPDWHAKAPKEDEFKKGMEELK